jgi:hypothetical protein
MKKLFNLTYRTYLEVTLIFVVFLIIGLFFNSEDPLFLKTNYSIQLIVILVVALWYGFFEFLLYALFLAVFVILYYDEYPIYELGWILIVGFLASEFREYWNKKMKEYQIRSVYDENTIRKLRREFYMLNLAYKELEFNYISRPYNVRTIISELREKYLFNELNEKDYFDALLNVLYKYFHVRKASVVRFTDKDDLEVIVSKGDVGKVVYNEDTVIYEAVTLKNSFYFPPKTLYALYKDNAIIKHIAAIVSQSQGKYYMVLIDEMDFVYLNNEVLNYIHVILNYLLSEIEFIKEIKKEKDLEVLREIDSDFLKDFYQMVKLYETDKIVSSLLIYNCDYINEFEIEEIRKKLRTLDDIAYLPSKKKLLILLPFTSLYASEVVVKKLNLSCEFL